MPTLHEGARNAQFLISEANGYRSRETGNVLVPAGATLAAGAILGLDVAGEVFVGPDHELTEDDLASQAVLFETLVNPGTQPMTVKATLIARDAEITGAHLTYPAASTEESRTEINAALAGLGLVVR